MVQDSARPLRSRVQLPDEFGLCFAERQDIEHGLAVVHSEYRPRKALAERSAQPAAGRTLVVTLALAGDSGYVADDDARLAFRGGFTTISSFHGSVGERRYDAGKHVAQLRLLVDEAQLQRYLGDGRASALLPRSGVRQLGFARTSPAAAAHAVALVRSLRKPLQDSAIDIHLHTLSLLAEQLRTLPACMPSAEDKARAAKRDSSLSEDDITRLHRLRAMMQSQLDKPLTIPYLCAAAGLSEFKLKQGCRQLFDRSPHQLLLDLRMQHAWTLLAAGKQVAQAAWAVGYQHPANFSAAFLRHFGRTPKSVAQQRLK